MALPHMPSYYTTRKNIYEAAIVRQRTREHDFREKWGNVASYFHKENVTAVKKKNWESGASFQNSMDAYSNEKAKELKLLNLKRRQSKLGEMLAEERRLYEVLAMDLMYEHWRQNNPDIRELESRKNEEYVIESWREQLEEQKMWMDLFLYLDRDVEETRGTATESPMGAGNDGGQTERDGKSKEEVRIWEEDHRFLQMLAEQEEQDVAVQSARKEKARADANWMIKVVEEQIKVEKAREAELDMLYQDEAAKIWQKRENEWEKERQARERLMKEVLEARQQQIFEKMDAVKEQQRESIEKREELLREMEIINHLTRREQERKEMEKLVAKEEITAQVTARQEQKYAAKRSLEEELALERKAEEDYEELLRREAEQLKIKDFAPKDFPRKTAWM
ncbi:hypothetical protein LSH36_408g00020 [Paralvinella palmiformis]|uniref:Trichoplein keratin filament-binding protein n=1 Tax=Paralvinella palmiformis TaxID=53620 RepID=A0AAD9N0C6_9ANNE|nr:hypothetical protein LSH36_408g00020 [Paralvinella palmiformis]